MNKLRFSQAFVPKRVVVKVGTSSLTHQSGLIHYEKIEHLVRQLADLRNKGAQVILVSSGAIASGMGRLNVDKQAINIAQKQALAAVGQNLLMHVYLKYAAEYGMNIGQILLTQEDIYDEVRGKFSKDALLALLNYKVLPIVNENDAVAVEEIKFGDNDRLSAMVAALVQADWLIILSDIDGLYDDDPKTNPRAKLLHHVTTLTQTHLNAAQGAATPLGTGGMITKLMAVNIAKHAKVKTVIANSAEKNIITRLFNGEMLGTYFEA